MRVALKSDMYTLPSHARRSVLGLSPKFCHGLWGYQMRESLTYLGAERALVEELQEEGFHRKQGGPVSAERFGKEMPRVQDAG